MRQKVKEWDMLKDYQWNWNGAGEDGRTFGKVGVHVVQTPAQIGKSRGT